MRWSLPIYGALLGCGRHTSENDTRPVDEQRSTKP
jgi:hypothetical protein